MRLLMTADAVGGVWTYAVDLARGLQAHGVETVLAVTGPAPSEPPDDIDLIPTGLPLDWLAETPGEVEAAGHALAELAGDLQVDLVQLNSPAYAAGGRFPAPVVGVQHSCTATWWRAVKGAEPWPPDFAWRFDLARRGLLACDRTVAPTKAFALEVRAEYGTETPTAVWNGRALPFPWRGKGPGMGVEALPGNARRLERARCEPPKPSGANADALSPPTLSPSRGKGVFTAGRLWDEGKGVATLDAAAARLSAPVLAAGPLAAPGSLPARFPHLRLLGVLGEAGLRGALAQAAVFVSPSLYEPFGLSVLEAAQFGRPLVLSDIPTFQELWDGAATFFPTRDPDALAEAVQALLDDAPRRDALGAAALERARRYTVEAMAGGMAGLFRAVISAR